MCERCRKATDAADRELHRYVALRAGAESPLWPHFRDTLSRKPNKLTVVLRRTETAWDGLSSQVRALSTYDKALIQLAVEKLARGLTWILGEAPEPPRSPYDWDARVGTQFSFDGAFKVVEYEFGDRFHCALGDLRVGRRWHISYAGRVHFAISYVQPPKLRTLRAATAYYMTSVHLRRRNQTDE